MKKINLIMMMFLIPLIAYLTYGLSGVFIEPSDGAYWILGGTVNSNLTFKANCSPTATTGNITNYTYYSNATGTWGIDAENLTNDVGINTATT